MTIEGGFCTSDCAKSYHDRHPLQYCKQCNCEYEIYRKHTDNGFCSHLCKTTWDNLNIPVTQLKKPFTKERKAQCAKSMQKLCRKSTYTDPSWMKKFKSVRA